MQTRVPRGIDEKFAWMKGTEWMWNNWREVRSGAAYPGSSHPLAPGAPQRSSAASTRARSHPHAGSPWRTLAAGALKRLRSGRD